MKTLLKSIWITGMFLLGTNLIFGQEMQMHNNHSGHDMSFMKNSSQVDVPVALKKQLSAVVDGYMELKDALVASDETGAVNASRKTLDALNKVDMTLLKGESHNRWMKIQQPVKENLNGIVMMKGLGMKRSHFSIVSQNLTDAVKTFGIESEAPLYVEYCPMANESNGAFWLSYDKEIENPYYGSKMLTCGEVKSTIQ